MITPTPNKRKVNPNSSKVYHEEIEGVKEESQALTILSAFVAFGKPATARMIQKYLKDIDIELEVNVMSRGVNSLHSGKKMEPAIVWVCNDKCEVTNRVVSYYEPILKL
jgi:hypothetical protein